MKLSMWMIANRLQSLDMKLDIRGNAPVILNSARRVYATNCVHVYAENNDVICNGEGDSIRFEDTDLTLGFLQSLQQKDRQTCICYQVPSQAGLK